MSYTPPEGWKLLEEIPVTVANQDQLGYGPLDSCGLRLIATNVGGTGQANYAPPVGWTVIFIRSESLGEDKTLWMSTDGSVTDMGNCERFGGTGSTDADLKQYYVPPTTPTKFGWGWLAGAMLFGLGIYIVTAVDKKTTKRRK